MRCLGAPQPHITWSANTGPRQTFLPVRGRVLPLRPSRRKPGEHVQAAQDIIRLGVTTRNDVSRQIAFRDGGSLRRPDMDQSTLHASWCRGTFQRGNRSPNRVAGMTRILGLQLRTGAAPAERRVRRDLFDPDRTRIDALDGGRLPSSNPTARDVRASARANCAYCGRQLLKNRRCESMSRRKSKKDDRGAQRPRSNR